MEFGNKKYGNWISTDRFLYIIAGLAGMITAGQATRKAVWRLIQSQEVEFSPSESGVSWKNFSPWHPNAEM